MIKKLILLFVPLILYACTGPWHSLKVDKVTTEEVKNGANVANTKSVDSIWLYFPDGFNSCFNRNVKCIKMNEGHIPKSHSFWQGPPWGIGSRWRRWVAASWDEDNIKPVVIDFVHIHNDTFNTNFNAMTNVHFRLEHVFSSTRNVAYMLSGTLVEFEQKD